MAKTVFFSFAEVSIRRSAVRDSSPFLVAMTIVLPFAEVHYELTFAVFASPDEFSIFMPVQVAEPSPCASADRRYERVRNFLSQNTKTPHES